MFCVTTVKDGKRALQLAIARWAGFGTAARIAANRSAYQRQTSSGSRANASGVARSSAR